MVRSPSPKIAQFSRTKRRGVERKGQQIRIRVEAPARFEPEPAGTQTPGRGVLQRIGMRLKRSGKWKTQSWRINMSRGTKSKVLRDIDTLKPPVTEADKARARVIAEQYFQEARK